MAQLWPADGGVSRLDLSDAQWSDLENVMHLFLDQQNRLLIIGACNSYLDWEFLQDAATGKPSGPVAWLKRVKKCANQLAEALAKKRNQADRAAANHLRVAVLTDFETLRRGLTDVRCAAEQAQSATTEDGGELAEIVAGRGSVDRRRH